MENFWKNIKLFLSENMIKLLCGVISVAGKIIDYMRDRQNSKIQQQNEEKIQEAEKKIDAACDKGGINDLFEAVEELKKAKKK